MSDKDGAPIRGGGDFPKVIGYENSEELKVSFLQGMVSGSRA
jgi:hypothetical protein